MIKNYNNPFIVKIDQENTTSSSIDFDRDLAFENNKNSDNFDDFSFSGSSNNNDSLTRTMSAPGSTSATKLNIITGLNDDADDDIMIKPNTSGGDANGANEWHRYNPFKIFTKSKEEEFSRNEERCSLRLRKRDKFFNSLKLQKDNYEISNDTLNSKNEEEEGEKDCDEQKMKTTLNSRSKNEKLNITDIFPPELKFIDNNNNDKINIESSSLDLTQLGKTKFKRDIEILNFSKANQFNETKTNTVSESVEEGIQKEIAEKITPKEVKFNDTIEVFEDNKEKEIQQNNTNISPILKEKPEININNNNQNNANLEQLSGETLNSSEKCNRPTSKSGSFTEYCNSNLDITKNANVIEEDDQEIALKMHLNFTKKDCKFLQTTTGIAIDDKMKHKPKLILSTYLTVIYDLQIKNLSKDKEIQELKAKNLKIEEEKMAFEERSNFTLLQFENNLNCMKTETINQNNKINDLEIEINKNHDSLYNKKIKIGRLYNKMKIMKQQLQNFQVTRRYYNDYISAYTQLVATLATHSFESKNKNNGHELLYFKDSQSLQAMLNHLNLQYCNNRFFKNKKNVDDQREINNAYFNEIESLMIRYINEIYKE
ncbi:hypothetical protein ACO0SA_004939 [Hanseniaspora valbyensis]